MVARIEAEKNDPCFEAKQKDVPCFPVRTDMNGADGLGPRRARPPRAREGQAEPEPAADGDEMGPYRANPIAPSLADVTFDPGCVGK